MFSQQNPQTTLKNPSLPLDSELIMENQKEIRWWETREGSVGGMEGQLHPINSPVPAPRLSCWKPNPTLLQNISATKTNSRKSSSGSTLRACGLDPQNPSGNPSRDHGAGIAGILPKRLTSALCHGSICCYIPSHPGDLLIGKLSCSWVFNTCLAQHVKHIRLECFVSRSLALENGWMPSARSFRNGVGYKSFLTRSHVEFRLASRTTHPASASWDILPWNV